MTNNIEKSVTLTFPPVFNFFLVLILGKVSSIIVITNDVISFIDFLLTMKGTSFFEHCYSNTVIKCIYDIFHRPVY